MSRPLTSVDYQALAAFRRALRGFLRFSEQAARSAGVTPAQHQLMLAIRGHAGPGEPSISEVAEALQLQPHSALELVGRAETNGLVLRHTDPSDHRRTLLGLSADGATCLAALSATHRAELRRFRTEMTNLLALLDD